MSNLACYEIKRHKFGWLLDGPDHQVSIEAITDLSRIAGAKAVMLCGVAHHYNVVAAVSLPDNAQPWIDEIEKSLEGKSREERWLRGTDTGISSQTIFRSIDPASFYRFIQNQRALERFDVPHDADDFERCKRLLVLFPEWRERLGEVAAKHPETAWPKIIQFWDDLCAIKNHSLLTARLCKLENKTP
jgi:hypothetical protein